MVDSKTKYKATVIVTSDTCSLDPSKDTSGQYVVDKLIKMGLFDRVDKSIVKDDKRSISKCLQRALDDRTTALIITVGGTGLCPRDVTPEATKALYERECSGIVAALHATSLRYTPHAALSRLTSGIAGNCLIINFPGRLKACEDCIGCIQGIIKHAIEQIRFDPEAVASTHMHLHNSNQVTSTARRNEEEEPTEEIHPVVDALLNTQRIADNYVPPLTPSRIASSIVENTPDRSIPSTPKMKQSIDKPIRHQSPYPLIDHQRALEIMSSHSDELRRKVESVDISSIEVLKDLVGDILAVDECPRKKIPEYPVSTMDGFILHIPPLLKHFVNKIKSIKPLLVDEEVFYCMRQDPKFSTNFFCCRVNTGGRLPEKDFAVIPVEMTDPPTAENTLPLKEIRLGKFVREAGSDISESDVIKAGTRLGPIELSILLSMGCKRVTVIKRPKLAIMSTGDELEDAFTRESSHPPTLGLSVTDVNGPLLALALESRDYYVENVGIVRDEPNEILLRIRRSLDICDILIITGGASMGSKDHVKDVIEQIGGTIHYGRVNIKPGKPAAFATVDYKDQTKFIFSLPGNPVSAYVTSQVLVVPFIEHGIRNHFESDLKLSLDLAGKLVTVLIDTIADGDPEDYKFDGRLEFVRAKFSRDRDEEDKYQPVTVSIKQQSSRMLSLLDSDCLVIIDPHLKGSRFHVGQICRALIPNR